MNVAFIPVRGGSKSIPLKNIKVINKKPLVYWTVKAVVESKNIDKVYVATDSPVIKETVEKFEFDKVEVIGRSAESASDTASTEFAMLEFANQHEFDNIVLVQATSPLLTAADIDGGFELYHQEGTDSVLSAVRQYRFNWQVDKDGFAAPINYDFYHRPRRQEFDGYLTENGAFYITSKERLLKYECRLSGNVRAYEMSEDTFFEIDEPSDWVIIEQLMKRHAQSMKMPKIKMFLTDCDGCLTDAGMYYTEKGDELKKFSTRDGMGIARMRDAGIITGIVTSENVEMVKRRGAKLQMPEVHLGVKNKLEKVTEIAAKYNISLDEIAYVGDDINDLEVIKKVGFGCSVNDAMQCVKDAADYVSEYNGGNGAIRDIAEKILANAGE